MNELQRLQVCARQSLRDVMTRINQGALGLALVVDNDGRFVATVTDGDVRRAILRGATLDSPVSLAMQNSDGQVRESISVTAAASIDEQLRVMRESEIRHLPLLDSEGRVVELATLGNVDEQTDLPVQAVIMAGGFGTRLRPLTDDTPKPMLSVGGQPLMERTIRGMQQAGIQRISITTHYMPEKIKNHFGDGGEYGVQLKYIAENKPLGTAGSLALVEDSDDPLLVVNGDILTRLNYRELVKFHCQRGAELTIGARHYEIEVPYGVLDTKDGILTGLREKPKHEFLVNSGVYVVQPSARKRVPLNRKFNMTDLIEELLAQGRPVACFPIIEYWLDIGKHDDFERAQDDVRQPKWAA